MPRTTLLEDIPMLSPRTFVAIFELRLDDVLDSAATGYALQLSDGSMYSLPNPAAEMLNHIGARMWVRLSHDGMSTAFGIIAEGLIPISGCGVILPSRGVYDQTI